ncbi:ribosome-binding factor A [Pedobacter puniceum]|jgi:ribosome-binding factor A|uniref:Ribosome-binding factor A n=1 Tax=Pedobacter puniceum TaxID=2666136 RepID=A0A7K0FQB5_9SPHI|nr:ribosome-binding factor A [Pedobacter puniceum]MRX47460.1 ribosome-binding factor A [Pedobacter puniceum]
MESKRQQKFARVIQKDLGEIFQRDAAAFLPGIMITVTKVRATADLGMARVFLSFFNAPNPNLAISTIKTHSSEIRYMLGKKIKDQVKGIPQLDFFLDDTNEYVDRMDKIFSKISKEEDSE